MMYSKTPDPPPKWSTNEDGFKDDNRYIEGILSSNVVPCPASCDRLTEYGAAKRADVKASSNPDEESSGACGGGNKGSIEEGLMRAGVAAS